MNEIAPLRSAMVKSGWEPHFGLSCPCWTRKSATSRPRRAHGPMKPGESQLLFTCGSAILKPPPIYSLHNIPIAPLTPLSSTRRKQSHSSPRFRSTAQLRQCSRPRDSSKSAINSRETAAIAYEFPEIGGCFLQRARGIGAVDGTGVALGWPLLFSDGTGR